MGTRGMADVGDHGPDKTVNAAHPVAPPHQGISPWLVIQIFQKTPVVTADLDLERNTQSLNCACRSRPQISISLRREASLKN